MPILTILVYDYAGVPPDTLLGAEQIAGDIFLHAGVEVIWRPCRMVNSPSRLVECPDPSPITPGLRLVHELRVARHGVRADAMGYATGDLATVSMEFIERLQKSGSGPLSEILGSVMAHEVGHLLLPGVGHSIRGIMRARWTQTEWVLIGQGRLHFVPEQARILKAEVLTRMQPIVKESQ